SRTDVPSGFLEAAGHLSGGTGSGAGNRDAYATRHRLPSLASAGLFFPPLPSRRPVPLHPPQLSVRRRVPVRRKTDRRLPALPPTPPLPRRARACFPAIAVTAPSPSSPAAAFCPPAGAGTAQNGSPPPRPHAAETAGQRRNGSPPPTACGPFPSAPQRRRRSD